MKKVHWYASGGGVSILSPYPSQIEAYRALLLTEDARNRQTVETGKSCPYPVDTIVWPELARYSPLATDLTAREVNAQRTEADRDCH